MREHDPDIMLLAEHYLSSGHRFDIDGYIIFRRDRVGLRGVVPQHSLEARFDVKMWSWTPVTSNLV